MEFIKEFRAQSEESRRYLNDKIMAERPNFIPCIVDRASGSDPKIDKNKFTIPDDHTVGVLYAEIRRRITLNDSEALFFFVNEATSPAPSSLMSLVYQQHKNVDGFLYITYTQENAFGATR